MFTSENSRLSNTIYFVYDFISESLNCHNFTITYQSGDSKGSRTREGEGNKVWDHMDLDMWPNCFLCSTECIYDASIHNYTIRHGLPTLSTLEPRKRFIRFLSVQGVSKAQRHYKKNRSAPIRKYENFFQTLDVRLVTLLHFNNNRYRRAVSTSRVSESLQISVLANIN